MLKKFRFLCKIRGRASTLTNQPINLRIDKRQQDNSIPRKNLKRLRTQQSY
jgi:hypothetical protein